MLGKCVAWPFLRSHPHATAPHWCGWCSRNRQKLSMLAEGSYHDYSSLGREADSMRFETPLLGLVLLLLLAGSSEACQISAPASQPTFGCAVTTPNGIAAGEEQPDPSSYGNRQVSVGLFGTVVFKPGGAGFVTRDGSLGMKFGWRRGVSGQLRIEGRRLDAEAPPLRAEVPSGYGDRGLQATYVIFPTPGCWEVTGRVGDASVTFVTSVVKIGDGPAWRRDVP
jgi:hypothetical protein